MFKYFALIFLLASCGPAAKLRRAEKLIKKAEELGAKWHSDTIKVEVPVFVPETRVDSIFVQKPWQTVTIEKDRLKVVIKRLPGDTVKVEAECKADTIYKQIPVRIERKIEARGKIRWYHLLLAFLIGAATMFVLKLFRVV